MDHVVEITERRTGRVPAQLWRWRGICGASTGGQPPFDPRTFQRVVPPDSGNEGPRQCRAVDL
jgi:hypothetical protein